MNQPDERSEKGRRPLDPRIAAAPKVAFRDSELVQSKLAVLAMLFFVTGFLGLPLLWLCRRFSPAERWIWAIINTVYTCVLIWIVYKICMWSWNQISQTLI